MNKLIIISSLGILTFGLGLLLYKSKYKQDDIDVYFAPSDHIHLNDLKRW